MTNLSLKEQLQALSLETPLSSMEKKEKNPQKQTHTTQQTKQQKPQWLEQAQYGVELLKAYFPACFKEAKHIQPLKIGIKHDLVKRLSTLNEITITDKACMVKSLAYYVNSSAYHKTMVAGATRIDLEGNQASIVTKEEAAYSIERRSSKMRHKKPPVDQSASKIMT
jgi:ProP effector